MTFFAKNWFDRFLGRRRQAGGDAEGQRAQAFDAREAAREPASDADVEEGATAARDDTTRREPMPPPGTG
jgi:hypothetical protein